MDVKFVDPNSPPYVHFSSFSASWVALFEFFKLLFLSMRRDLKIFMKLGFLGAVCVTSLSVFVIIYGFLALGNTTYQIRADEAASLEAGKLWVDPSTDVQDILLFNSHFSNLGGIMGAGYFLHQFCLPVLQKAKEPEKTSRNLFIGYFAAFLTYVLVGVFGYYAFSGRNFKDIFAQ